MSLPNEPPSTDRAVDRLLTALGQRGPIRASAGTYTARCPAHDDRNPSLSVAARSKEPPGAVLRCHRGCDTRDVLAALGMAEADLYDEPPRERRHGHEASVTYSYRDARGRLLYEVVRLPGKSFRQRRPDGHGGWTWSLGDVERVPYRLPELLAAKAADLVLWVVEGEKDVEALRAHGLDATCNSGGAGKWTAAHARWLTGADVTVVADRDDAGRRHAEMVVNTLLPVARSIDVLEARYGKDSADHLAAGGHSGNFLRVAEPKPYVAPPEPLAAA